MLMNNVDYFNQQLEVKVKEMLVHHRKVYGRNRLRLEKLGNQEYLRKFDDDFEASVTFINHDLYRDALKTLPSKLEDQTFRNQREYCAFCIDVIHKMAIPFFCYGVEMEEANLRASADQYIRTIKEKEGKQ
ncbi:hypothetical protein DQ181_08730 [Enterococcus faecium]|nr:hypothetical protein [Enterococcus faecium]